MKIYRIDGCACRDFLKDVRIGVAYLATSTLAETYLRNRDCTKISVKLKVKGVKARAIYMPVHDPLNYFVITEIDVNMG